MRKFVFTLFVFLFCCNVVYADKNENIVNIYFFHSNTCSHCMEEDEFLEKIEKKYDNVKVYRFEIHEKETVSILEQVKRIYKISSNGVPVTVIGNSAYTGFDWDKASVKFIKTIEYYSRYGYADKVREVIEPGYLDSYRASINHPKLYQFMSNYKSHSILGINIDSIDTSVSSVILGVLSVIHIPSVIAIIVVFFLLHFIGGRKNKMLLLTFYLAGLFLLRISSVVNSRYFTMGVEFYLLISFMLGLFGYCKNKRREYLAKDILIIMMLIIECCNYHFFGRYVFILRDISFLHLYYGFDKIYYYASYFFSILMIYMIVLVSVYFVLEKNLLKR